MAPGLQELRGGELEFLGGTQQLTRFHASAAMFKKELDKGDKVEMFIQKEAVSGGEAEGAGSCLEHREGGGSLYQRRGLETEGSLS